jgi:nucleotide-binding universal stress UspA family protein
MTASAEHEIVVGVDGSPASAAALRWAGQQARLTGCALRAVMAWEIEPTLSIGWPPVPRNPDAEQRARSILLAAVKSGLGENSDLSVAATAVEGAASEVLSALSREAELLVVGNRGHRHAAEAVLGSVSQHCVFGARCPVVVVRGSVGTAGIVVGVDTSAPSVDALEWAARQAARSGSTLRVVRAATRVDARQGGAEAERRRALEAAAARAAALHGISFSVEEREGEASSVLVAASDGAELLVVGSRGRGPVSGVVLGSVSQRCVQHAMCPVVVHRRCAAGSGRADVA